MKYTFFLSLFFLLATAVYGQDEAQKPFNDGVTLLRTGKYADAEIKFTEAIKKGATRNGLKMSYVYKGLSLNGQDKYDEALESFSRAIEIDSLDPATYIDRAKTFSYKKDYKNATSDFHKVIKLNSSGQDAAYYYLGRIKMLQGKNEEAIIYFDSLLKRLPNESEGYFLRGTAKSNMMDIDGSISDFDLAIKYNPDYMEAYANRGVQKINKIPTQEKIENKSGCIKDPCTDLLRARKLGDTTVEDMILLYCKKCGN